MSLKVQKVGGGVSRQQNGRENLSGLERAKAMSYNAASTHARYHDASGRKLEQEPTNVLGGILVVQRAPPKQKSGWLW